MVEIICAVISGIFAVISAIFGGISIYKSEQINHQRINSGDNCNNIQMGVNNNDKKKPRN